MLLDLLDSLVDAASPDVPLPRVLRAMFYTGLLGIIPSALLAGSGGHGGHFHPITFAVVEVAIVATAGLVARLTSPRARARRAKQRRS